MVMNIFQAGKGINATKINDNFSQLQNQTNTNETNINTIANTALLKDGSNLTQSIVNDFNASEPIVLESSGTISLTDNRVHYLTLTANNNNKIQLPSISSDSFSHTIVLIVAPSNYSLNIAEDTYGTIGSPVLLDSTLTYSVMYVYNKIDNHWYYTVSQ
jgi:hypothetical protein